MLSTFHAHPLVKHTLCEVDKLEQYTKLYFMHLAVHNII